MTQAMLFEKLDNKMVRCLLCAHYCVIAPGKRGICQVRENREGLLYSLVYGRTISQNVDPIEKKPLYHFYPGSLSFSIAAPGCNFHCDWCQNWEISQMPCEQGVITGNKLPPEDVVKGAVKAGCRSIAYTYTEPTLFFEYCYETAKLAREAGLTNVFISNGYMSAEMLEMFHPLLDAANIDLKAFRDETYRGLIGGKLQPVLDSLSLLKRYGVWTEVTTLIIPEVNDSPEELRHIADFIVNELGTHTPWHVSRFFPQYKRNDRLPTSPQTILDAVTIGKDAGLQYIYPGNLGARTDTLCPGCHTPVIGRHGYRVNGVQLQDGRCSECNHEIAGVWPGADGS